MIIDGRTLATDIITTIKGEVADRLHPPRLVVFTCSPNFETKRFLTLKQQRADEAGIRVEVVELPATVTLSEVATAIRTAVPDCDGIIIQFPFPHILTTDLIPLVPASHDVDVMQYTGWLSDPLPPVVGAIDLLAFTHGIEFSGKSVVVVGSGRLVGTPTTSYAKTKGATVTVVTKESNNLSATKTADIIILGAGSPGLLTPELVKDGVVVFDAGTSEEGGVLVGDADPAVAHKASLFTPVPGGIGPLTIAVLLKNVLTLAETRK